MGDSPNPYDAPNAPLDDPSKPKRKAPLRFSLLDVLVVLAIIGVLIALLLPAAPMSHHHAARRRRAELRRAADEARRQGIEAQGVAERPVQVGP
jgi:hypothetical protein